MRYWLIGLLGLSIIGPSGCNVLRKKSEPPPPLAAPSAAPAAVSAAAVAPPAPPPPAPAPAAPVLGEVRRFIVGEKPATGAVRVTQDEVKIYNEPDEKTPEVATLSKGAIVFRLVSYGDDWMLVEFPSGVGKVSPGWVPNKSLDAKADATVQRAAVGKQKTTAKVTAATTSATAAASAAPTTTATAAATTTATAAATTTATAPKNDPAAAAAAAAAAALEAQRKAGH